MYRIQKLLKNGRGPMSPVLFAQEVCKEMGFRLDGLYRVWFDDPETHQIYEGKGRSEMTGHDTLIIIENHSNCTMLAMIIDAGSKGIPVSLHFTTDETIELTDSYSKWKAENKLTHENIRSIFERVNHEHEKEKISS